MTLFVSLDRKPEPFPRNAPGRAYFGAMRGVGKRYSARAGRLRRVFVSRRHSRAGVTHDRGLGWLVVRRATEETRGRSSSLDQKPIRTVDSERPRQTGRRYGVRVRGSMVVLNLRYDVCALHGWREFGLWFLVFGFGVRRRGVRFRRTPSGCSVSAYAVGFRRRTLQATTSLWQASTAAAAAARASLLNGRTWGRRVRAGSRCHRAAHG